MLRDEKPMGALMPNKASQRLTNEQHPVCPKANPRGFEEEPILMNTFLLFKLCLVQSTGIQHLGPHQEGRNQTFLYL